ncbi:MAG: hypothetical protein FVQ85_03710 [Planctomycetes bacterium]|nr:hypothetical protein [Planctomycetota bacterium]
MNERTKDKAKTVTGVRGAILRNLWLYVLGVLVLAVFVFLVLAIAKKPRIYPPHQIAVNCITYDFMDRIEEVFSFYADWSAKGKRPGKKKTIELAKRFRFERHQPLERKIGPVEIRENETFDEATRVVVPILSVKLRNPSTGKVKVLPDHKIMDLLLEKQETPEGKRWHIISPGHPSYAEIKSTWLNLPRKKVPHSPTIIFKRAVVIQIVSDGKVVSERTVFCDEWGGQKGSDEKGNEPLNTENIEKSGNTVEK